MAKLVTRHGANRSIAARMGAAHKPQPKYMQLFRGKPSPAGGVGKPKAKGRKVGANRKTGTDAHWITVNGRHVMVNK